MSYYIHQSLSSFTAKFLFSKITWVFFFCHEIGNRLEKRGKMEENWKPLNSEEIRDLVEMKKAGFESIDEKEGQ